MGAKPPKARSKVDMGNQGKTKANQQHISKNMSKYGKDWKSKVSPDQAKLPYEKVQAKQDAKKAAKATAKKEAHLKATKNMGGQYHESADYLNKFKKENPNAPKLPPGTSFGDLSSKYKNFNKNWYASKSSHPNPRDTSFGDLSSKYKNSNLNWTQQNPNAPTLPPGTGIEGSPATVAEQAGAASGGPVKTETGITLTGVNADNYKNAMPNNPPSLFDLSKNEFKQQNPNAPNMPGDIGIQGAPANRPQQFQQPTRGGSWKGGGLPSPRIPRPGGQRPRMPRPGGSRPSGKGGQHPSGKGGQRPSPRSYASNPAFDAGSGTMMNERTAGPSGFSPFSGMNQDQISAMSENRRGTAAPMMKKAPAFKMRSPHSTTFKEMGSDNKKSAPTRKTGGGYKMPGLGKR